MFRNNEIRLITVNLKKKLDMKKVSLFLTVLVLFLTVSCEKEISEEERLENEINQIQEYGADNNLKISSTESGLHYIIEKEGQGNYPKANDNVVVRYKGYTLEGSTFDESDEDGIKLNLQQVIKGWTEGIQLFKEGGKGKLLIPSSLAYGESGS